MKIERKKKGLQPHLRSTSCYFNPLLFLLLCSLSLQHFDLVAMASVSLLSGLQFLAVLLKCDFLHLVVKKGYWALQVSCCFSSISTSLHCFPSCFSVSFVCTSLCCPNLPLSLKQVLPTHRLFPLIYFNSLESQNDLSPFFTVPHPFYPSFLLLSSVSEAFFPQLFRFDSFSGLSKMFFRLVLNPWLNRTAWKWTRWSFGILSKSHWSQKQH